MRLPLRTFLLAASIFLQSNLSPYNTALCDEPSQGTVKVIPESKNQVVRLTDAGIQPQTLHMKKEDSSVFFLNSTSDSLLTLSLDYGGKKTHCASSNLEIDEDGVVRSQHPFGPKDFASVCFPDRGTYDLTVYGLKPNPAGLTSKIIIE